MLRYPFQLVVLVIFAVGCGGAADKQANESKTTRSGSEAESRQPGSPLNEHAAADEQPPADTGGPKLIAPTVNPAEPEEKSPATHVVAEEVEYYKSGPQQGRPADGKLEAGTKVTLLESDGSYSRIRTEDGTEAFVFGEALKPIGEESNGTKSE